MTISNYIAGSTVWCVRKAATRPLEINNLGVRGLRLMMIDIDGLALTYAACRGCDHVPGRGGKASAEVTQEIRRRYRESVNL